VNFLRSRAGILRRVRSGVALEWAHPTANDRRRSTGGLHTHAVRREAHQHEEFAMSKPRRSYSSRKRLLASVKVAALLAALGFVTVVLEQPRLTASPTSPRASLEQLYPADAGGASVTRSVSEPPASAKSQLSASDHLPAYFPGQFAPPGGEVEPQPPTF
jgi:hypothetical protein